MPSNRGLANHRAVSPISDSNTFIAGFSATSESNDLMTGSCGSYIAALFVFSKSGFCVAFAGTRWVRSGLVAYAPAGDPARDDPHVHIARAARPRPEPRRAPLKVANFRLAGHANRAPGHQHTPALANRACPGRPVPRPAGTPRCPAARHRFWPPPAQPCPGHLPFRAEAIVSPGVPPRLVARHAPRSREAWPFGPNRIFRASQRWTPSSRGGRWGTTLEPARPTHIPGAGHRPQTVLGAINYQVPASPVPEVAGSAWQDHRLSHTGRCGTACGPRHSLGRSSRAQTGGNARPCEPARLRRAGDCSFAHLPIPLDTVLASSAAGPFAPVCRDVLLPPAGTLTPRDQPDGRQGGMRGDGQVGERGGDAEPNVLTKDKVLAKEVPRGFKQRPADSGPEAHAICDQGH